MSFVANVGAAFTLTALGPNHVLIRAARVQSRAHDATSTTSTLAEPGSGSATAERARTTATQSACAAMHRAPIRHALPAS